MRMSKLSRNRTAAATPLDPLAGSNLLRFYQKRVAQPATGESGRRGAVNGSTCKKSKLLIVNSIHRTFHAFGSVEGMAVPRLTGHFPGLDFTGSLTEGSVWLAR